MPTTVTEPSTKPRSGRRWRLIENSSKELANSALRVRDLWVELDPGTGPRDVLRGLDIEITPGERVALMGRNGAGKEPVVLGEKAGRGRTIIEKFEDEAGDAAYAVVLLTADDMARKKDEGDDKLSPRARQNVVLELGYFIGRIRRENVAVLYEKDVEIPSDYQGVEYISFSDNWKTKLMRELQGAGIEVSTVGI